MNIRAERERMGLSQAEFIRKLKPFMGTFQLDEVLLTKLEDGTGGADRRAVLERAMAKAFPAHAPAPPGPAGTNDKAVVPAPAEPPRRPLPAVRWIARAVIAVAVLLILVSFIWFQDHPYAKSFERILGFIAALGTIFSAYWGTRQSK